ncbi:hypothetical protein RMB13_09060 [Acinetobacter sp. V102_4]|uniref:hypothetical protein n=1 Tax=Acinetobacter sp. V102_4 TaxID=3072984 RepID=UPI00287D6B34|nr:hypothetical protein [Acinetobacter sp. V102_4]MDS7929626.1 hypothetical protein [Acinetobacter sp. V102_4]
MEKISIDGDLPVPIKILVDEEQIKCGKFVMSSMTAIEYVQVQAKITGLHYISISDVVAMTKLVDDEGHHHELTYVDLAEGSHFNLIHLTETKAELEAKVKAAS